MTKGPVIELTYQFYRAVKSSTSCVVPKCRIRDVQFHHVIPEEKKHNIAEIARHGTIEELTAELKKCVPVCDGHHKAIHAGRLRGYLVGRFNSGEQTWDDSAARKHMPYKPFFTGLVRS